jgi:hypothetical protein
MKAASSAGCALAATPRQRDASLSSRGQRGSECSTHQCWRRFIQTHSATTALSHCALLPHTAGSVAKTIWGKNGLHNGTIEATSREGCRLIKAVSPQTKCFIYHNMELALESMESQRAVMYDASKADYFLQYTDGQGNKNGTIYNERQVPGDQFFWDFNNPAGQSNTRHWSASAASTARRHHRHPTPPLRSLCLLH